MLSSDIDWIGTKLAQGRYKVTEQLGSGGMARVYRARDERLGCDVVVKVPHRDLLREDPSLVDRFAAELQSLATLCHPHIVKIIDAGVHAASPYAVLQYLGGGSLEQRALHGAVKPGQAPPMPLAKLLEWLPQIVDALDFIHHHGLVHRDVKPANILFDDSGHPYLSDFGVVKVLNCGEKPRLTKTGFVLGTPQYLAPEVIQQLPLDGRVDQYSLGVLVFELLLGKRPFSGQHVAWHIQHIAQTPPLLSELAPQTPRRVSEAVARAMAKNPAHRFANCAEFTAALKPVGSVAETTAFRGGSQASAPVPAWRDTSTRASIPTPSLDNARCAPPPPVPRRQSLPATTVAGNQPVSPPAARRRSRRAWAIGALSLLPFIGLGGYGLTAWMASGGPPSPSDLVAQDAARIIGRWRQQNGALVMQFLRDGTLREERLFDTGKGKYRLQPGRKIDMKTQGLFAGMFPTGMEQTLRYELTDDELVLTPDAGIGFAIRLERIQ